VLPTFVHAQQKQQHAIVKTRGRQLDDGSVATGRRISDALVDVKGTGKILSDDKGELSFGVSAASGYYLNNVTKEGYMLSDLDVISKQHQYQAQPVDILLESVEELNAYRRSIERKVRRNYQNQLDELSDRIDSLESADSAQAEEIARLRAELDRAYDEAEQYVDKMTEYYLNIDFDRETDFDIEISYYIINGMLDKADSLLATRGNIEERVRQNRMVQRAVERDKEMVAKDCYRKYEIASQRFERDTAAYYLKLRAELDPTNIDWQIDAAFYLRDIKADYDQALSIYESALSYSLDHYGEYHKYTALLSDNIGVVYYNKGDYDTALDYYQKALSVEEEVLGLEHPSVATS
jgi:tetratricopeptide (TPR) repeat protein